MNGALEHSEIPLASRDVRPVLIPAGLQILGPATVFAVRMLIRLTACAGVLQARCTGWGPMPVAVRLISALGLHLLSRCADVLGWYIRLKAEGQKSAPRDQ